MFIKNKTKKSSKRDLSDLHNLKNCLTLCQNMADLAEIKIMLLAPAPKGH